GEVSEQRRANAVDMLHLGKIARNLRLICQEPFDKLLFASKLKSGAKKLLITECGGWDCAQRLATRAACAMSGPDLQIVGQGFDALDALELLFCAHLLAMFTAAFQPLQQIGATDIAHKDKVTREDADG